MVNEPSVFELSRFDCMSSFFFFFFFFFLIDCSLESLFFCNRVYIVIKLQGFNL